MDLVPFRTPGLGDQTYLLTHQGKGVLVDPQRDIDRFLRATAELDVELPTLPDPVRDLLVRAGVWQPFHAAGQAHPQLDTALAAIAAAPVVGEGEGPARPGPSPLAMA